ncbi:MAG: C10 family peptidase [Candidatus Cloacimonetes bacterium]|nr:C10 family peptidase [Candidatus Cloacimonadota bacterium]
MRKAIIMLLILAASGILLGEAVNEEKVLTAAVNILLERGGIEELTWGENYTVGDSETDFYIYNYNNTGYVIIAGDDRAVPVLAYSFEKEYDPSNIPPQLEDWFFEWQWQMNQIRELDLAAGDRIENEWLRLTSNSFTPQRDLRDVAPLMSSNWNQDSPWNQHCPYGPTGTNPFVYAGCVATSMAQVMYYWGHPTQGTGSHSYNHPQYGNISCDFENSYFNYDSMNNNSATYEAKELQWAAGVAVEMDYGSSGSGAQVGYGQYSARNAMIANFDYHPSATFRAKDSYSSDTYEFYVREDLDNGYPLIYSGVGSAGGHAFNLDGYQGTSYFHFNFGWSGYGNGYFYLSNINPMGSSFNSDQGGVFSLFPYEDLSAPFDVTAVVLDEDDVLLSWDHNEMNRSLLGFNVYNNGLLEETTEPDENSLMINNLPQGTYLFWVTALFVTGESEMSEMVAATIAPPTPPIADAGEPLIAGSGENVTLDGSGSYDVNGDPLSFNWTAPAGIVLSGSNTVSPSFLAPQVTVETDYVFSLIVSDGTFFSEPDEVIVTVVMTDNNENEVSGDNLYLKGNYPNPFNPETEIIFSLKSPASVSLNVYNIKGELVKELLNGNQASGEHRILWQGNDENGKAVGNGIYYYMMRSGRYTSTGKMVLLK